MAAADDDGVVVLPHPVWLRYDSIRRMRDAETQHSTDTSNEAQERAKVLGSTSLWFGLNFSKPAKLSPYPATARSGPTKASISSARPNTCNSPANGKTTSPL